MDTVGSVVEGKTHGNVADSEVAAVESCGTPAQTGGMVHACVAMFTGNISAR